MNPAPTSPPPDYARLAAVGPYFALGTSPAGRPPEGFRPLAELYGTGPDAPLAARLRVVARRLGTGEPRVAASILHLGLAARFWSVGLGSAVLLGTVPTLEDAWMRIPDQGPLDLWTPPEPARTDPIRTEPARAESARPEPARPDAATLADRLHETVLLGQLEPLAATVRAAAPLSPRLLLGNAASALAETLRVLDAHAPGAARPLVAELLDREPLAGSGTLHTGPYGTAFRRNSCCLYYRVGPGAGLCGDCCFSTPPSRGRRAG